VDEAAQVAAGRAMLEVDLDLGQAQSGARGVDRHPELHAEPRRERKDRSERGAPQRALPRDRRLELQPRAPGERKPREAQRDPEAAAHPPGERRHRDVGSVQGGDERHKALGARAEVAVAEHVERAGAAPLERPAGGERRRGALAEAPAGADDLRPGRTRQGGGRIARAVVGDDELRGGKGARQRGERRGDALRFVAGADDDQRVGRRGYCPTIPRRWSVPDIEAHITGTVWKIEIAVGDRVEEGDTVAILESMKMEMPVEAEDAGTVREIVVEEGQAVNEGDTLIVLE
jgi:acetyl-CoA carboxylase biotin carboxyl carrier protein